MTEVHPVPDEYLSAAPHAASAQHMHHVMRERFQRSICALIESAQNGLHEKFPELLRVCQNLDLQRALSPAAYIAHYELLDTITAQDVPAVRASVEKLEKLTPDEWYAQGFTLSSSGEHAWDAPIRARLGDQPALDPTGELGGLQSIPSRDMEELSTSVHEARTLVLKADREMFGEMGELLHFLLLHQGSGVVGASSLHFFGAVALRKPPPHEHRTAYFFSQMIHETSHMRLNIVETLDSLVLNSPQERYTSPLRKDPRPVMGIFHAVYVLSRLTALFRAVVQHTDDPEFARQAEISREKFEGGVATLSEVARCTPSGQKLLTSMQNLATE